MPQEAVTITPGVFFAPTDSGGVLMDIAADRFVALSSTSAWIWERLAAGSDYGSLLEALAARTGRSRESATRLLTRQLELWAGQGLVDRAGPVHLRLTPKPVAPTAVSDTVTELDPRVAPSCRGVVACLLAERQYRTLVHKRGLASALVTLQREGGESAAGSIGGVSTIVKSYYLVRRAFRQGHTARDCLYRSLGLAAVLRRESVPADLCIGVTDLPFFAHAWVESGPFLVNEVASEREKYVVIGRF